MQPRQAFKRRGNMLSVRQSFKWCDSVRCSTFGGSLRINMKIVLLITILAFLLSTAAAAESNEQFGKTAAPRLPRAVILQPFMKVREEEDDGPFDWIANLFKSMTAPKKAFKSSIPPMLGPIRIPGVDDEVYIKQLSSLSNAKSRVVVRVVNPQMSVPVAIPTPYYTYHQSPQFPINPTRQLPIPSSGFVPMSSQAPTNQWQIPQQMIQHQHSVNYNRNNYQNGYNFLPSNYQNHQQYRQNHQPYYQSYYSRYQQNPYGTHDFDNSIQNSGRISNYISHPLRNTNYPSYSGFNEHSEANHDSEDIKNETINNGEVFDKTNDSEITYSEQSKVEPASSTITDTYKEIHRPDRMAPTNPTWRNRFWTRKQKNATVSSTAANNHATDDDTDEKDESLSNNAQFSPTDMVEVAPPDLKGKNKDANSERNEETSDSRMDDNEDIIGDEPIIDKIKTREIEKRNFRPTVVTENSKIYERVTKRKRHQWKPLDVKPTKSNTTNSETKAHNSTEIGSESVTQRTENATPDVIQKVMSLTATNSWKNQAVTRPSKNYARKNNSKNRNRRVRIVESVRSSVSVTSSKGEKVKSKSKS